MIKFFKNKIFIAITTIVLCLAISGVVLADAAPLSNDTATLSVNYNKVITENFTGVGANSWVNYLSDDNVIGATEAHADLNAKRIAIANASTVRYMFMPHYVMFDEEEDHGEAKWNAGEINYENDNLKAYVRQCQDYKAAGVRVMFNWGGAVPMDIYEWWGIKNVPDANNGSRSAPSDLERYADMFAKTLKYLVVDCGLTNIDIVNYHNEINHNNFAVFGDKRIIWTTWLKLAHNALKAIPLDAGVYGVDNLRDYVVIMGVDISQNTGFEGDWGLLSQNSSEQTYEYYKYLNENASEYYDYLSIHIYAAGKAYAETIDDAYGTGSKGLLKMCQDINKWYPGKFWVCEWAAATGTRPAGSQELKNLLTDAFEHSSVGQAITHINTGMVGTQNWGYFGGTIPKPLDNTQSIRMHETYGGDNQYKGEGESFIIAWNAAGALGNETAMGAGKSKVRWSVNGVIPHYGQMGLLWRYVPSTNKSLNNVAQTLSTTSSSENIRFAAMTQKNTVSGREDITYLVELNDDETAKSFEINVADKYKDKNFNKFVFEYHPDDFGIAVEGCSDYDANMVLNTPKATGKLASSGKITDNFDASKHYFVVYTTLDEAQQVYFSDEADVEIELDKGASHTYSAMLTAGIEGTPTYRYEVLTGADKATITQDGVLTINSDAASKSWISVKVTAEGASNEAYAIGVVYIK